MNRIIKKKPLTQYFKVLSYATVRFLALKRKMYKEAFIRVEIKSTEASVILPLTSRAFKSCFFCILMRMQNPSNLISLWMC